MTPIINQAKEQHMYSDKMPAAIAVIEAVLLYLSEMAERGDYQAKALLEQVTALEENQSA